jgi:hypothetical protein
MIGAAIQRKTHGAVSFAPAQIDYRDLRSKDRAPTVKMRSKTLIPDEASPLAQRALVGIQLGAMSRADMFLEHLV